MSGGNQGSIQGQEPASGGGGTCVPVSRTLQAVAMDSGAMADLITGAAPAVSLPTAPAAITIGDLAGGGGAWAVIAEGGGAAVDMVGPSSAGPITITSDSLHKAALNIGLLKTGGGQDQIRIWAEADYGAGFSDIPGAGFIFNMGSPFTVEHPAMSLEAPLFSASFVPVPGAVPPVTRWRAQILAASGGAVEITRAYFYVLQEFPVITSEAIQNCEDPTPPACPAPSDANRLNLGTGEVVVIPLAGPALGVGAGSNGIITVNMDAAFDAADYTATVLFDGVVQGVIVTAIPGLPPGAQTAWQFFLTQPAPVGTLVSLRVELTSDPLSCSFTQLLLVTT